MQIIFGKIGTAARLKFRDEKINLNFKFHPQFEEKFPQAKSVNFYFSASVEARKNFKRFDSIMQNSGHKN